MREALEDVASSKMAEHVCEARAEDWWSTIRQLAPLIKSYDPSEPCRSTPECLANNECYSGPVGLLT